MVVATSALGFQANRTVPHFANQRVKNSEIGIRGHQSYHLVTVSVFTHYFDLGIDRKRVAMWHESESVRKRRTT